MSLSQPCQKEHSNAISKRKAKNERAAAKAAAAAATAAAELLFDRAANALFHDAEEGYDEDGGPLL